MWCFGGVEIAISQFLYVAVRPRRGATGPLVLVGREMAGGDASSPPANPCAPVLPVRRRGYRRVKLAGASLGTSRRSQEIPPVLSIVRRGVMKL